MLFIRYRCINVPKVVFLQRKPLLFKHTSYDPKKIHHTSKKRSRYKSFLETDSQDWIVKGFIDIDKNVYTITNDTKVVSKIIEILLIPKLDAFARNNGLELELPSKQNFYPDLTFKDGQGHLFAVDFINEGY